MGYSSEKIVSPTKSKSIPIEKSSLEISRTFSTPKSKSIKPSTISPILKNIPSSIPLPSHFVALEKMFTAMEYTLSFQRSKGQSALLHRVQKPIENMCGR